MEDEPEDIATKSGGVGMPIPQTSKAARKGQGRGEKSEN
jgi:hypothetical protein